MSEPEPPVDPLPDDAAKEPGPAAPDSSATVDPTTARAPAASMAPTADQAEDETPAPAEPPARPAPARRSWRRFLSEPPEVPVALPRHQLTARSRRDFLLWTLGALASAAGAWWLLPDRTRGRLAPGGAREELDRLIGRTGLTPERREQALRAAISFDDDVAEALYSKERRVRTYRRSETTALRNNYAGRTPGPGFLPTWSLQLTGLASGRIERLPLGALLARFEHDEQVTRLVCVEGWSAIAWWGGLRFADLIAAFPPAPGMRWAAMRSSVNLDRQGRPNPYYVSIDLETARHPQTLLATHQNGRPLTLAHGAPLRLVAPMKLGLKNIKAATEIAYTASEPPDYWNERGYSKYDGL